MPMKMPSATAIYDEARAAAVRHKHLLLSLLATLLSCPFHFYVTTMPVSLDGSWMRALNMAIDSGRVFGRDFIFTYGPLGFLSTRNPEYIHTGWLLAADLLIFSGFFYLVYRHLARHKGWWVLLIAATLAMRAADYTQVLFLLFAAYVALLLLRADDSKAVPVFAGVYGVLLFFIKVNYALVSAGILAGLIIYLALQRRREAWVLAAVSLGLFIAIYLCVHIDLAGYVRYSIPLIAAYDEAMYIMIDPTQLQYKSVTAFFIFGGIVLCSYFYTRWEKRDLAVSGILVVLLLSVVCFLYYRNGFTRHDAGHYQQFFSIAPMFFVVAFYILGLSDRAFTKLATAGIIWVSFLNFAKPYASFKDVTVREIMQWVLPFDYYMQLPEAPRRDVYPEANFPTRRNAAIGKTTIDILPNEIAYLQLSGYNYCPRPVPQSYTVYSGALDSVNARFYAGPRRPGIVLIKNGGIDNRYYAWDESLTKAALHLNYALTDTFCSCTVANKNDLFLLRAVKGKNKLPQFDKIREMDAHLNDTVRVPAETNGQPLYVAVDVDYTTKGLVSKILYQPLKCYITLFTDDGQLLAYRLIRPMARQPMLISRLIENDADLANFLYGNIMKNKKITAFVIHTPSHGTKEVYRVRFYRFGNY